LAFNRIRDILNQKSDKFKAKIRPIFFLEIGIISISLEDNIDIKSLPPFL